MVNGIVTIVIVINEYNSIVNVCLPISIDFLDVTEYIAQKIADPIPAIIPIHEMSIEFSSRSPVTNVQPISTRITHNTLIEVKSANLNSKKIEKIVIQNSRKYVFILAGGEVFYANIPILNKNQSILK